MKWIYYISLLLCMGCQKIDHTAYETLDAWMRSQSQVKVLASTAMIGDLAAQIGGEEVCVLVLIGGGLDPHTYEIVKGDDEKIHMADCVIVNGLGLEHGASLQYLLEKHPHVVSVGDWLANRHPDALLFLDDQVDPHVWTDVLLWVETIEPIKEALIAHCPWGKGHFEVRAEKLKQELLALHAHLAERMQTIPEERRFLVTSHDAFRYFARRYLGAVDRVVAPEGLAPEGQMRLADIHKTVAFLQRVHASVLFPESNVPQEGLKKIQEGCLKRGLAIILCDIPLYGDAMGKAGSSAGTYVGMMEHNVETLCRYLNRPHG